MGRIRLAQKMQGAEMRLKAVQCRPRLHHWGGDTRATLEVTGS